MAKVYVDDDGKIYKSPPKKPGRKVKARGPKVNKETILEYMRKGVPVARAIEDLGITQQLVHYYKRSDPYFKEDYERLRLMAQTGENNEARTEGVDFPEFCERYLDTRLFNHQLQWYDILEGREPRNLHPSQVYKPGDPGLIIVNTPPEHAKSTTITVNYVTYRICMDPNVRIIVVSQNQGVAKQFLHAVKDRLAGANPAYRKLQADFAPNGGFDENSAAWAADKIYVNSEIRDSGEPTPTLQALGLQGQIYGNRADLIILDDTITGKNAHEFEKQINWIQREVMNRLTLPGGTLLLVGTRLAPVELYSEIQKPEWYGMTGESPWTYLTQPAVLEYADDPKDWVVLAPWSNRPPVSHSTRKQVEPNEDGLYPWHSGEILYKRRMSTSPANWAMVYQQEQVSPDAIFRPELVKASIDGMRAAGVMVRGAPGHREHGMEGLHVIGGFDPAITGHAAAVVLGVDRMSGVRWVLDVWTKPNQKPDDLFDKIKEMTAKYHISEWSIEKNAMNLMVTQNRELRNFLASRGCQLREHFTGSNKNDIDFGVASMASLFEGAKEGKGLIRLPSRSETEGVSALVEQLCSWFPQSKAKQDTVMALWFAETLARNLVHNIEQVFHTNSQYHSPRDRAKKITIDLDYMANQAMAQGQRTWS